MTAPTRYAVILDPLGMANVVSDREPGPGPAMHGLTGEWVPLVAFENRYTESSERWDEFDEAIGWMREYNARHKPARPAERAGEV